MSRQGVTGFNAARLEQIMAVRRQTQAQLAAMVGVSSATMSKWKNGLHAPDAKTLERLASVLNVSAEWFTRPMTAGVERPLFRSNASAHAQARSMLEERANWVKDIISDLTEYMDFPVLNIPQRHFESPEEISQEDIEEAALEFRKNMQLGLAPIQDLTLAAEGAGVFIVREQTGVSAIEGLSTWTVDGKPVILLSSDKENAFRSRFDLGHELGHLILHKHIPATIRHHYHKLMEQQAHAFAGALLLPAESFSMKIRIPTTLDDFLLKKQYWGVSVAAMIMRLYQLDMIDDHTKQNLFKRISMRWGRKAEPGDGDRKPEEPRLLRRSMELLIQENIISLDNAVEYFGIGQTDLLNLLNLDDDFFEAKRNKKVIPFLKVKSQS